jgi:hypothetical protein
MATREEELALLGILESQLGERQRAMNGLHIDEDAVRDTHAEMLELQRHAKDQQALELRAEVAQLEGERRRDAPGPARHRRPGLVGQAVERLSSGRRGPEHTGDEG